MPDALGDLTGGLFSAESVAAATGGLLAGAAPHQRSLIRQHVAARLRGVALAGMADRVQESRELPVNEDELPRILVYTLGEVSEPWSKSPDRLQRDLELVVEIVAGGIRFLDQYGDGIANVIEHVVMTDPGQGGLAVDTWLSSTQVAFAEQQAVDLVLVRLMFTCRYQTEHVELVPDDLAQINAALRVPTGTPATEDLIDLPVKEGP